MMKDIKIKYFDHAATTPVREEVLKEMLPFFSIEYGNASAAYRLGRNSKRAIELARSRVAKAIGCSQNEVYFTSCGSESDNLALKGVAYANKNKGNHIITTKIEHHAILESCATLERQGYEITYLNVDENGFINLQELENSIKKTTILISIMFANNEIGTIQPVLEIGSIAKKHNILFHTDSVQAIGNVKINVKDMNIDLLSLSAHKFYGPKGIGALYIKQGTNITRIQDGGHQEKDKRAGTENVAEIVALGKAIQLADNELNEYNTKLKTLRNYMIKELEEKIPNIKINGDKEKRLPGNVNVSFKYVDSQELLMKLDEKGFCASAGSACSTGVMAPSHVLLAIGLKPEEAQGTLRFTLGRENTKQDVDDLIENLQQLVKSIRKRTEKYNNIE